MTTSAPTLDSPTDTYRGFELTRIVPIPEINVTLRELIHKATNAQVIHLGADDPENVFCISFKTIPEDSRGVAHILEHIVLAGSEKFPIRDPFFSMTRRSLNTFMNAFTGSDFTCYPAATQVETDFYNLLEVYIDAVFHPKIDRFSFLQEGHRLEFADPEDPASPLLFKGVVFNEMKGALSTPVARLYNELFHALYPDITYGVNSGGDPKVIPDLSWDDLKEFHSSYYHPSRAIFYFYGDISLQKHLDYLEDHALAEVEKKEPLPLPPKQKRFTKPKEVEAFYPSDGEESSTYTVFGWLTTEIADQEETLALTILDTILMGTDAAPLKMALLRSGLCSTASSFLETDITEVPYALAMDGCKPGQADQLEKILFDALNKIYNEGFSDELIESAIHQIEFSRSEITEDGYPHGLNLYFRSTLLRQHGIDPEEGLKVHTLFDKIRQHLEENPKFFRDLLKKHFIDNTHRVRLILSPSTTLADEEFKAEQAKLEAIRATLTEEQVAQIVREAALLKERQEEEEDVSILPKLSLHEIPHEAVNFELLEEKCGNLQVYRHECFTNEVIYADISYDLPSIPATEWPKLRLFASLLSQMGCAGRSYGAQLEEIQAATGGIGVMLGQHPQADNPDTTVPTLSFRGKALYRNGARLCKLLGEMVQSVDFTDKERLREVIMKQATQIKTALNSNAMSYARQMAASTLRQGNYLSNNAFGLPYYTFITELADRFDEHADAIVAELLELKQKLLASGEPHLVISCDAAYYASIKKEHFFGLTELENRGATTWKPVTEIKPMESQGIVIPSPVAFTAHAQATVPYTDPDSPALSVASQLFEHITLHRRIREQGGAYGSGAANKAIHGIFSFYGYRDPNIASTLAAFKESIDRLLWDDFTDEEFDSAKLEVLQGIDSPIAPGSRADVAYIWMREGRTLERRTAFRDGIIGLTRKQLKEAVEKHLVPGFDNGVTITFAGRTLLDSENKKMKTPLAIREI